MLQEYPTTRCSKKCHMTGRVIEPGEDYVSALITTGRELVRIDVAAEQWNAPPEGTVGWWKCKMPDRVTAKLTPAPNGVLLDSLTELLRNPTQAKLAYLLALLLVRRRVLVDEESLEYHDREQPSGSLWRLLSQSDGRNWDVPIVPPQTNEETERLRQELLELLFTED